MKIAILGAGNMGGAIARGLLTSGVMPDELVLTRRTPEVPKALADLGLTIETQNTVAVAEAEVVIVAVKPWLVSELLQDLPLKPETTVISVAAKVSLEELKTDVRHLKGIHVVRAMPNTAVALRCGVTALAASDESGMSVARALFERLGMVVDVPEEKFPAMTALSGCGIAHALRFLRAGQTAGVEMGIPATDAAQLFAQVMKGAAELILQTRHHPEEEIDRVCTPGGLTIQGLHALEEAGFSAAVVQGLLASYKGN